MLRLNKKKEYNIYQIFGYFIIYSILGLILETIFALIVYGSFESRKGFLYGPFCPIYGVGAVILTLMLTRLKNKDIKLFFSGMIVGSLIEYIISLIGELLFNARWWDYSNNLFNINGRICLQYSLYWGIISFLLIKKFNPLIEQLINWIKSKLSIKIIKMITIILILFLLIDFILSGIAVELFVSKTVVENNIQVNNKERYVQIYTNLYDNNICNKLMENIWTNEKIIRTYPNLKLQLEDGTNVLLRNYYKEIIPYYYKFKNKEFKNEIDFK